MKRLGLVHCIVLFLLFLSVVLKAIADLPGLFLYYDTSWNRSKLPVRLHYNESGKPGTCPDATTIRYRVQSAYNGWSNGYSFFSMSPATDWTTTAVLNRDEYNVITWGPASTPGAQAETFFNPWPVLGTGTMTGADIQFSNDIGQWSQYWYFPESPVPSLPRHNNEIDFIETMMHEMGHVAGLKDMNAPNSLMHILYPTRTLPMRQVDDGSKAGWVYQHTADQITLSGPLSQSLDIGRLPGRVVNLTGPVTIPAGKTFKAESGTTVNLGTYYICVAGGTLVDPSGVVWNPYDVAVYAGSTPLGHFRSIATALVAAGSGHTVIVKGGTHTLTSQLTVPSGKTLQLNSATLSFTGNYKLRVEGKLITTGSCVFTRSGGQWYGIEFYNGNSGSSLYGCTIQNAQYGVYVYNTVVPISHNTIQYNSTGIYANAFWNPAADWNLIRENYYGVYCANYGDINLTTNNILRYNSYAVWGDGTSQPYLSMYTGANSLYWNDYYDIYSDYGGTIYARGNWWGSYPAYPIVTGNVDYSNALSADPNNWAKIAVNTDEEGPRVRQTAGPIDTVGLGELDAAHLLMRQGKNDQALILLQALASRRPENLAGMKALVLATRIREEQGVDAGAALQAAITQHTGTKLELQARQLLVGINLKQGNVDNALALAEGLTEASDPLMQKLALYDAGNILWYRKSDPKRAEVHFRRLASLWPEDPLTVSALATMGESYEMPGDRPDTQLDGAASYAMAESYPNPFNPTTAIRYTLADDATVSLIVTDILGRVVARLVDEHQVRGSYSSTWNASRLASGIYFARLTVTDDLGQVKFTKVNKLLLMK